MATLKLTPLMQACQMGDAELVKSILSTKVVIQIFTDSMS